MMVSLVFFLACLSGLGIYYILPQKMKRYFLLFFSWGCYFVWNSRFLILLISFTLMIWTGTLYIQKTSEKTGRIIIFFEVVVLFTGFYLIRTSYWDSKIGMSFFLFQAIGYLIDVYKGEKAETNFAKVALFMDFFPIQISGPIERGKHFISQIDTEKKFVPEQVLYGIGLVLWGLFQKIVIADRCAIYVDNIYGNYQEYTGWPLLFAVFLFSIQIYTDFSGYTDIATGLARCFGYDLLQNFKQPYFSYGIKEFWKRWHISLTCWLTDYIYKPLGGSRKGSIRTFIHIFIVFLVSGIWHGSGITFLIWGSLHAMYQCIERAIVLYKGQMVFPENKCRVLSCGTTFFLVSFAWIFFRSDTMQQAKYIILNMWIGGENLNLSIIQQAGLDFQNVVLLMLSILGCMMVDQFRGKGLYRYFRSRSWILQWLIIYLIVFAVIIFGIYGPSYDQTGFLYSNF